MKLQGLHHITLVTGDAQKTVDFYVDVLGLRMVKKTVNFDDPTAYHLYFGDDAGTPGSILTWFEYPGAEPGIPGPGMVHTIQLGIASAEAIDFWASRLQDKGYDSNLEEDGSLLVIDWEGMHIQLVVADPENPPLRAAHPEIPAEMAIVGVEGARAYSAYATVEERVLSDLLGFTYLGGGEYRLEGGLRNFRWGYDQPYADGAQGGGTVHHIAWATPDDAEQEAWHTRLDDSGAYVTDVLDRDYFRSIYFREPRNVLFEIATIPPGFTKDEEPEDLGDELKLPRMHEHLRAELERSLTPIVNPRTARGVETGE
ncbi:MAG TPA: VOC family protein [Candidatus Dormibacteraeota bacterium]|jgi:glyoxalase family protein|nr:VOC family protein [Candidatus Dormibacteraeota bacterium]